MLQIIVIYLGPGLLGIANPWPPAAASVAAVVSAAINYACYFSGSTAAASRQCPQGRTEARQVLGMTKLVFFKVTLLQVVQHILPPVDS